MERVSIVIPIHNEEASIALVLEDVQKATPALPQYEFELIVVDDGSTDRGGEIARSHGVRVVTNPPPYGKGAALRAGFAHATGDIIVMMDGDYSHMAEDLGSLISALKPGVSLVIGSRSFGGTDEWEAVRAIGNTALSWLFGLLYRCEITDTLNGYKAFRRAVLARSRYTSVAFEIEMELLANAIRCGDIVEVTSHERARVGGQSKSKIIRHGTGFLVRMLRDRFLRRW
jgi:glycosyltransferase involved in cell wall biosynthesis